jgi:hypothetical protein
MVTTPAVPTRVPSKCPKLDVEELLALPERAYNARLIVDNAGVAHVVWVTLTWPRNEVHAAYHHAREVNGRWEQDDAGLPTDVLSNTFDVGLMPDGKTVVVAIASTNNYDHRTFTLYAGSPWKAIGSLETSDMTVTFARGETYAAAWSHGRLGVYRVSDRLETPALAHVDVPKRANAARARVTDEGLTVDLENNLHSTNREPRLRITKLDDATPVTRELALGGPELGPRLDGDRGSTFITTMGKQLPIAKVERLQHCVYSHDCEDQPPATFTTRLRAWDSRLAVRKRDMVVVGMAWTVTGPIKRHRAPPDSGMPDDFKRSENHASGVLIAARADGVVQPVFDETSWRFDKRIAVDTVAVDATDRIHALVYEGPPLAHPRYVRLGCAP